ncbi:mandelate racemase/muconate lactonizing enzyme family protein [Alicyclobacillus dauci]|uniref:Mandelate racemase/muconate lactonizing enzyme family protein n=1 Tax=Alicyclobacillus dauci TaxID=1475485 RepID=A0ABY6Z1H8_9BACL|nr:mandelate racemase/muconate lactonizing enzyme family protein [Alicyclobacillus dauci]WAH36735.1 mandelate racemase/muconate lactonizing enzyme family protein [Alicyclobacillus dauci]
MQITALETIRVEEFPNICFVHVHTDEGLVGLGETYFGAASVEAWVHESAAPVLVGQDPLNIEKHWQSLVGFIGSRSTGVENRGRSAVDIALWDLLGQVTGQPIYQLLGGAVREKIPAYNTCAGYQYTRKRPKHAHLPVDNWGTGGTDGPYEDLMGFLHRADELAESLVEEGYMGMKIWPFDPYAEASAGRYISPADLRRGLEPFEKIRKAVGDKIHIMVEMHSRWDLRAAKEIAKELEPFQPFWFEDPIRMDNVAALNEFAHSTRVPTAASETLGTRQAYLDVLQQQAAGVLIFDPTWTGGISEAKRIASIAEAFEIPVATHDCVGPVSFAVDVHLSTHLPNALVQEVVRAFYSTWYKELVTDLPKVENGYVYPLSGPGLGTKLNPEVLKRADVTRRVTTVKDL